MPRIQNSSQSLEQAIANLPAPLNQDEYTPLRQGIWDADDVAVYRNVTGDFAFLHPIPFIDYENYWPRSKKLNLSDIKKTNTEIIRRFEKIKSQFDGCKSVLEIGASEGAFLDLLHSHNPLLSLASVEPDQVTTTQRDQLSWLVQFDHLDDVIKHALEFDVICLFHVFEHIAEPSLFLEKIRACLIADGGVIIEVPSLMDPLLKLYGCEAYARFYYQAQHPYIYGPTALSRVLEQNRFKVVDTIAHQRYGIANHLNWLVNEQPGGSSKLREIFRNMDDSYRYCIEKSGISDSFFMVAKPS